MNVAATETFRGEVLVRSERLTRDEWAIRAAVLVRSDGTRGDEVTLVGNIAHLRAGDRAEVAGRWDLHPQYGRQLKCSSATPLEHTDAEGALDYLARTKHIGKRRAALLHAIYGEMLFPAVDANAVAVFATLKGVGRKRAAEAAASWHERRGERPLLALLAPHGLANRLGAIRQRYGADAYRKVSADPYGLIAFDGISFVSADRIARQLGVPESHPRRAHAALLHCLREAEDARGHVFVPRDELLAAARSLVGDVAVERLLELEAPPHAEVVIEGDRVYRRRRHRQERVCAGILASLSEAPRPRPIHLPDEPSGGLTAEQWQAVRFALARRVSVISGGPGTGKSHLTAAIVQHARRHRLRIALCAPTAKAASRLQEASGAPATTIHKLLEWRVGERPGRDHVNPLDELDLVLVDECPMIGLGEMEALLQAIGQRTSLVLIGDVDQLEPVSPGRPYADIIESGRVPVTRLTENWRQRKGSLSAHAIEAVKLGRMPPRQADVPAAGGVSAIADFFFIRKSTSEAVARAIEAVVCESLPRSMGVDPYRDVLVLAPVYKRGAAGINALNERLRARLNPDGEPIGGAEQSRLHVGDRVLVQSASLEGLGLARGELAFVRADYPRDRKVLVVGDDGEALVPYRELGGLVLAWAMSVHRAQGSQARCVVAALDASAAWTLNRPLIYTAMSRGRERTVLIGQEPVMRAAIRRRGGQRYTWLAERLAARC